MNISKIVLAFFCVCFFQLGTAQEDEFIRINGKVNDSHQQPLESVYVRNMTLNSFTITTKNGSFTLVVREGDTLRCNYIGMKDEVIGISAADVKNGYVLITMKDDVEQLSEVTVEKQTIDEVTLGLVKEKKKSLTKNERLLRAAGDFKAWHLIMIPFGGMPFDPVINAISGRTKRMKKYVAMDAEKTKVNELYEKYFVYATMDLKVPEDDVMLFMYFISDTNQADEILTSASPLDEFLLADAYQNFLESQTETDKK